MNKFSLSSEEKNCSQIAHRISPSECVQHGDSLIEFSMKARILKVLKAPFLIWILTVGSVILSIFDKKFMKKDSMFTG